MVDSTSLALGLLGGAAVVGFAGWIVSRWLQGRSVSQSSTGDPYQSPQFAAIAQQALAQQTQQFVAIAQQGLAQNTDYFLQLVKTELDGQFSREREAVSGAVTPLKESLVQVQGLVRSIEQDRNQAYGSLDSSLKNLMGATASLQKETTTLSSALRNPKVYGRWGEVALRRLVELAGMTEHCDFDTQVSLVTIEERLRPDLVIYLPSGRVIPVDSKVSISAFLDAETAKTDDERQTFYEKHADQVRARLRELASKEYAEKLRELGKAPEFAIMFIPGDNFLEAALTVDPELFEEGASKNVMLASPTMLLPLLRVVEVGWRQERFLQNIERLRDEARVLYDRLAGLTEHLGTLGKRLEGAVSEYNAFVGSYDSRVIPQARKFEEMGVQGTKTLPDVQQIEARTRRPKQGET
jgi:DNA recombination protein RmuC